MDGGDGIDLALTQACIQNQEGKATLRCEDAFALAARFAVPVEMIGRLCNERGIKIVHCQLGCFA